MSFSPPSQGTIKCTATSIGAATAKTQLNGAVDVRLPTICNAVHAVTPFWTPGTLTVAETINGDMILESTSIYLNPTRFYVPNIPGGLTSSTGALHPILSSFPLNVPVNSAAGPAITVSGQALVSNTSAPKMGAIFAISNKGVGVQPNGQPIRQIFWNKRNGVTLGQTTAGTSTETSWQINAAERIITAYAAAQPLVITASESISGIADFGSPDFQTTIPLQVSIQPIVQAAGAAQQALSGAQPQWGCDIPVNPVCNLSPTFTNDKTLTAAVNYISGVAFYQLGR